MGAHNIQYGDDTWCLCDLDLGWIQEQFYILTVLPEICAGSTQYIDVWAMFEIVAPVTFD